MEIKDLTHSEVRKIARGRELDAMAKVTKPYVSAYIASLILAFIVFVAGWTWLEVGNNKIVSYSVQLETNSIDQDTAKVEVIEVSNKIESISVNGFKLDSIARTEIQEESDTLFLVSASAVFTLMVGFLIVQFTILFVCDRRGKEFADEWEKSKPIQS